MLTPNQLLIKRRLEEAKQKAIAERLQITRAREAKKRATAEAHAQRIQQAKDAKAARKANRAEAKAATMAAHLGTDRWWSHAEGQKASKAARKRARRRGVARSRS